MGFTDLVSDAGLTSEYSTGHFTPLNSTAS
jgi:hypothetical protein